MSLRPSIIRMKVMMFSTWHRSSVSEPYTSNPRTRAEENRGVAAAHLVGPGTGHAMAPWLVVEVSQN